MNIYNFWLLILCFVAAIGCSTIKEVATPGDSSQGYNSYQNEKGETVYRKVTPHATPSPYPTPLPSHHFSAEPTYAAGASPALLNDPLGYGFGLEIGMDGNHAHLGAYLLKELTPVDVRLGVS